MSLQAPKEKGVNLEPLFFLSVPGFALLFNFALMSGSIPFGAGKSRFRQPLVSIFFVCSAKSFCNLYFVPHLGHVIGREFVL
jgi:hypothetical protein